MTMGFNYDYGFYGDISPDMSGEGFAAVIAVYMMIFLFSAAAGLVFYLLEAFGLYKMAKTAGVAAPGLAFVPIANVYILGKVAETPVGGKKPMKYGLVLLLCNIGTIIITAAVIFFTISILVAWGFEEYVEIPAEVGMFVVGLLVGALTLMALSIAYIVFYYMAIYKIFKLFAPDNAVVFLVLTIFFNVALPIIIFVLRNRPICGCGQGQIPHVGTPGYNPAYGDGGGYNPYGYTQGTYSPYVPQKPAEKAEQNQAPAEPAEQPESDVPTDGNDGENL